MKKDITTLYKEGAPKFTFIQLFAILLVFCVASRSGYIFDKTEKTHYIESEQPLEVPTYYVPDEYNKPRPKKVSDVQERPKPIAVKSKPKTVFGEPLHVAENYVDRFSNVAIVEMQKYGIPASIKLAQGLLESGCGQSSLSSKHNNHFGIKCHSKSCEKGHCVNKTDDSHKDFFRKYDKAWTSYRAHSELLSNSRYGHLKEYGNDYESWAHGLKKAGYATDKKYAQKIIKVIEDLELYRFDE